MARDNHSAHPRLNESTTYVQWLTHHENATLAALITRTGHLLEFSPTTPDPQVSSAPALSERSAAELAVLHALTEIDAARQATDFNELSATLEELFTIAATPSDEWLTDDDLLVTVHRLAADGLVYGDSLHLARPSADGTSTDDTDADDTDAGRADRTGHTSPAPTWLKLAPTLPDLFDITTQELWRLADCNRCPIPSEQLSVTVDDMPPRWRRLINTLYHAGGVGHSESLRPNGDPNKPLPTMVREGLLDQLDDNTVRLTGRLQQHLNGTMLGPVGGLFRPIPDKAAVDQDTTDQRTPDRATVDAAASSAAVQTIHELAEVLAALRTQPLQPLSASGVGVRELTKLARAISTDSTSGGADGTGATMPLDELTRRLELAVHCGLVYLGDADAYSPPGLHSRHSAQTLRGKLWAITPTGLEFLSAPIATAWALLLRGWAGSDYAPWLDSTPDHADAKPLADSLFHPAAAALRALVPTALDAHAGGEDSSTSDSSKLGNRSEERLADLLWRRSPYAAWTTPRRALFSVMDEARALGIFSRVRSGRELIDRPSGAAIALQHAALQGTNLRCTDLSGLVEDLSRVLPEPVRTLIVQADHTILAPGLLTSDDHTMLQLFSRQESNGIASVWRVTEHSLLAGAATRPISEFLCFLADRNPGGGLDALPQSLRYLAADVQRTHATYNTDTADTPTAGSDTEPATVTVAEPPRLSESADLASLTEKIHDIIAAVRDIAAEETIAVSENVESPTHSGTVTNPRDMLAAIKHAYRTEQPITITYATADGTRHTHTLSIVMVNSSGVSAVDTASGRTVHLQAHRLISIKR